MTDIVNGFENMVWRVIGYDGTEQISEETIPVDRADESAIVMLLRKLAASHLSEDEIQDAPGLLEVRKDLDHGNRVTFSVGENPHYVASMWRADEIAGPA
jgi:hypothetical protein